MQPPAMRVQRITRPSDFPAKKIAGRSVTKADQGTWDKGVEPADAWLREDFIRRFHWTLGGFSGMAGWTSWA